jgi:hypothetical protein
LKEIVLGRSGSQLGPPAPGGVKVSRKQHEYPAFDSHARSHRSDGCGSGEITNLSANRSMEVLYQRS